MSVKDWRGIFTVELIQPEFHINIAPSECDANCLEAKELKCTCKCNGANHGRTLKLRMKPLTEYVEPEIGLDDPNDYSRVY